MKLLISKILNIFDLDLRRKSALKTYLETLMPIYLHN